MRILCSQYAVMNGSLFIDIVCIADATRKKLLPGAIPTLNLPQKTFETETKPRREIVRLETDAAAQVLVNNRLKCINI